MRYRRDRLTVHTDDGPSEAWVYIDHRVDPGRAAARLSGAHHRRRDAPRAAAPLDRVPAALGSRALADAQRSDRVPAAPHSLSELLADPGVIEDSTLRSRFGFMAIHGGGLEQMTDVIAERAADAAGASVYVLRHPEHYPHHLAVGAVPRRRSPSGWQSSSTMSTSRCRCTATAGSGRSTQLLAGGRNRELAAHLARHVDVPGYQVVTDLDAIPRELRGMHPDNPVNRVRGGGTQLELTPRVRGISPRSGLPGDDGLSPATSRLVQGLVATARSWQLTSRC